MSVSTILGLRSVLLATACMTGVAMADEPTAAPAGAQTSSSQPVPTRHQLMKDCMAKQRAAGSGKPNYELSQDCRDIIKTEKENAQASKKTTDAEKPAPN